MFASIYTALKCGRYSRTAVLNTLKFLDVTGNMRKETVEMGFLKQTKAGSTLERGNLFQCGAEARRGSLNSVPTFNTSK